MYKIILVLSLLLFSLQSQAGLICGELQSYESSYTDTEVETSSCAKGFACVDISGKTYKFDEKKTSQEALNDLYFAYEKITEMDEEEADISTCLITNDKDGSLKSASTKILGDA